MRQKCVRSKQAGRRQSGPVRRVVPYAYSRRKRYCARRLPLPLSPCFLFIRIKNTQAMWISDAGYPVLPDERHGRTAKKRLRFFVSLSGVWSGPDPAAERSVSPFASMIVREGSQIKGAHFRDFTATNVCFLVILLAFALIIRVWI